MRLEGGDRFAWCQRVGPGASVSVGVCGVRTQGDACTLLRGSGLGGLAKSPPEGQTVL